MSAVPLVPGALVLNVSDTERAATFWTQALGYARQTDNPSFLAAPTGEGLRIHLDEGDRMHLDVWVVRDVSDLDTEVERLVALGATRVAWTYPDDADFVVLADTEGNLFCVIK